MNSNRVPLSNVGGMSVSNHDLHRMNAGDPLTSMMKGIQRMMCDCILEWQFLNFS